MSSSYEMVNSTLSITRLSVLYKHLALQNNIDLQTAMSDVEEEFAYPVNFQN